MWVYVMISGALLGLFLAFRPYMFIDTELTSEKLARYKDY